MNPIEQIQQGNTAIGIEFGSTRIKAVLTDPNGAPLAAGVYDWENRCEQGVWTYTTADIQGGLRGCFADLMQNVLKQYDVPLETTAAMGISAMMHGYFAFGADEKTPLVPFRTWRNTMTQAAADKLTDAFSVNIPQRWSVAHLYQAILNGEPHVAQIRSLTTLAGYVHRLLTGENVLGVGDASGMFPIDHAALSYDKAMLARFDALTAETAFSQKLCNLLPRIVPVGECAGRLTAEGARLLDPSGTFRAGVPLCPPEGDAQTGMVATNSIAPRTGNVSAGTSIFAMVVLERALGQVYRQIDLVQTPDGNPVAMVHCNNCTTDLDAWVRLFGENLALFGVKVPKAELYDKLYAASLSAAADCDGIVTCNYYSGEHVTGFTQGRPLLVRTPDAAFTVPNLMRSLIYTAMATLKLGMDILTRQEAIRLEKIYAHGGLFKSPVAGQRFLAAALDVPVALLQSAGEGGAWGIAVLAAYQARENKSETLSQFLNQRVFAGQTGEPMPPDEADRAGFTAYIAAFQTALAAERAAVSNRSMEGRGLNE